MEYYGRSLPSEILYPPSKPIDPNEDIIKDLCKDYDFLRNPRKLFADGSAFSTNPE